jgi:CubicO group peptidase (beta-lactamase class C family)
MIARREFLLGTAASAALATRAWAGFARDDEIRKILRERVDQTRQSVGIVASVFDSGDQKTVCYGRSDAANGRTLDGDTVFEIGSITKVFTALLLTEMVTRGEVALG